jgi:polyhydroxyalkanoate synthesis regulator phasin
MIIELFNKYSISELIIFLVIFCLAVKEIVNLIDWAKERFGENVNKGMEEKEKEKDIQRQLDDIVTENKIIKDTLNALENQMNKLAERVNLLISSDKDDIKAYITERHHFFCYKQGWIDDYSLDCLEKRYEHYTAEGGNSFVSDLMKDIRQLPKQPRI